MLGFDKVITDGVYRELTERIFEESPENGILGSDGTDSPIVSIDLAKEIIRHQEIRLVLENRNSYFPPE